MNQPLWHIYEGLANKMLRFGVKMREAVVNFLICRLSIFRLSVRTFSSPGTFCVLWSRSWSVTCLFPIESERWRSLVWVCFSDQAARLTCKFLIYNSKCLLCILHVDFVICATLAFKLASQLQFPNLGLRPPVSGLSSLLTNVAPRSIGGVFSHHKSGS